MTEYCLSVDENVVRLWLRRRLPLEPKGEVATARRELARALRCLVPPQQSLLHGTYRSLDGSVFDVENVLFYNVGSGPFARAARHGMAFERFRSVPPHAPDLQEYQHFHEYRFRTATLEVRRAANCSFTFTPPYLSSATKTHEVWWRASESMRADSRMVGPFGLRIDLQLPYVISNVAGILKSLVDGVVSALHVDPNPSTAAVERLSMRTGWGQDDIHHRLANPAGAVLGSRAVLSAYRKFVKWDPADHLCDAFQLTIAVAEQATCTVAIESRAPQP